MRATIWCTSMALLLAADSAAADFGSKGGPEPANIDQIMSVLLQDPYEMELLISFGTSKGGSAGHLALAVRDEATGEDVVYSANFYADRAQEHAKGFYTDDLIMRIPKKEYLFKTSSSLGETASFGLDFGEIYKRSVIGVRVYGMPAEQRAALIAFFARVNEDYLNRRRDTGYHDGEIVYGYLNLNCAKAIGMGFKYAAGYKDLEVKGAPILAIRKIKAAVKANTPTEMAMKLLKAWNARGYDMDVVLYRKYEGSTYVDPHEDENVAFKDLPNRFPSVLSRDFRREQGEYRDFDNLFAMYVLSNMAKYTVEVNSGSKLLELGVSTVPLSYAEASERAAKKARSDSWRLPSNSRIRQSAGAPKGNAADARVHGVEVPQ